MCWAQRRQWLAILAAALLVPTTVSAGEPSEAPTWHCWTDSSMLLCSTVGGDSLWFGSMGVIWQVDAKSDRLTTFTVLDGLPLDRDSPEHGFAAKDGKFAVLLDGRVYLWRASDGFVAVNLPNKDSSLVRICFDGESRLHLLDVGKQQIYILDDRDSWQSVRGVPACQAFVPVKGGFVLGLLTGGDGVGPGFIGRKEGAFKRFNHTEYGEYDYRFSPIWLGERMVFRLLGSGGKEAFCSAADGKLTVESTARGLDLKTGQFLDFTDGIRGVEFKTSQGESIRHKRLRPPEAKGLLLRDRRGRLWSGPTMWKGRQWISRLPATHLPNHERVLDPVWYRIEEPSTVPQAVATSLGPEPRNYLDSRTMRYWQSVEEQSAPGEPRHYYWEHVQVEGPKRKVVRRVERPTDLWYLLPQIEDAHRNWWSVANDRDQRKFFVTRLDKAGHLKTYACESGIAGGGRPQVQLSPDDNVWLWEEKDTKRYDVERDEFVSADARESFAFRFGDWTLAMCGPIGSTGQTIYRRGKDDSWVPLPDPFSGGTMRSGPGLIHGDRMLLTSKLGVVEYDASGDRWSLLHTNPTLRSRFDEHGQRWLVNHRCALMYDGDPFSPTALDPKVAAALSEILKLMDHDEWRIREEATARLKRLYPNVQDRLQAVADDESYSPEVRWRLKQVLAKPMSLQGLLSQRHPPVKTVGDGGTAD